VSQGIAWTTIEDAIQAWVVISTGLAGDHCIWSRQNRGRPSGPFALLSVGPVLRQGQDWVDYAANPLSFFPITVSSVVGSTLTTATPHGLAQGDGAIQVDASKYGLATGTDYWAYPTGASSLQLASSFQNAWVPTLLTLSADSGTFHLISTPNTFKAGSELLAKSRGMRKTTITVQIFGGGGEGSTSPEAMLDAVVARLPRQASTLRAAGVGVMNVGAVRAIGGGGGGVVDSAVFEPRAILDVTLSLKSEVQDPETFIEQVQVTPTVDGVDQPEYTIK
jgi:hypothetical protein